jgi:hypothetical protein
MSKSGVFVIGALAFCLGLFVGLLVMSSETKAFKEEKIKDETTPQETIKDSEKVEILTSIDFPYRNVNIRKRESGLPGLGWYEALGEITNNSDKSFSIAYFTLSMYDKSNNLVDTSEFTIHSFGKGQTKSFRTEINVDPKFVDSYRIDYEHGF